MSKYYNVTMAMAQSGTLSAVTAIEGDCSVVGMDVPTIDTATVYIQAATSETGTFRRIQKTDGSGDWSLASGTGNKMAKFETPLRFPAIRVESSAAQNGGARTFTAIIRDDG